VLERTARALRRERSSKPLRELELQEGICGGRTRTSVDDMVGVFVLNRRRPTDWPTCIESEIGVKEDV
jgi:hypothetical protein